MIVGSSEATKHLDKLISSIAPSDGAVLITGESGCGKELYARDIHNRSGRRAKPFVAINCGAIPSDLLESQLFGHKRGAFTGAISDFKGKFLEADEGTLFLDEIGDMPFEMQVKLLRVLQERNVSPIGSNSLVDIDVRIVAATHRNIEKAIDQGLFRQDLYFRLNVLPLVIKPLRERPQEIPELVAHFAGLFGEIENGPIRLGKTLGRAFEEYDWPGNVRELANTIQRFSILYAGKTVEIGTVDYSMLPAGINDLINTDEPSVGSIEARQIARFAEESPKELDVEKEADLSASTVDHEFESIILQAQGLEEITRETPSLKEMLGDVEQDLISKALGETAGNVSRCAKLLKMQRTTLIERIKKYDLQTTL